MRYVFIDNYIEINNFKYPTLPSGARADVFTATGVGVTIWDIEDGYIIGIIMI